MGRTVIVVGLGSMGKRRIRILKRLYPDIHIGGIDSQPDRRRSIEEAYGIETFSDINEAMKSITPSAGFVCAPPLLHYPIIMQLLENDLHVFTEINLVSDGYDVMTTEADKLGRVLFLSSTFLYRKDIQYIIDRVDKTRVNYLVHVGQYLPDWHPWESYQSFFVKDSRTNACREIMAIDLPWIIKMFGPVRDLTVHKGKDSSLNIDYNDNYVIGFEHENGSRGVFLCDILTRKGGRSLKVFSEQMHIEWQGTPDSLFEFDIDTKENKQVSCYDEAIDHQAEYQSNIIENAYAEEIASFFGVIAGKMQAKHSFEEDKRILELADRIEGV